MKRINTMVATILGTVANAYQLVINLISVFAMIGVLADVGAGASVSAMLTVIIISILMLAVLLVAFILTCRIFKYMNATSEVYKSKKGLIIAAIVFNFLVVVLLCIGGFEGAIFGIIMNVLSILLLVATNVLYIVDLCLEKGRVARKSAEEQTTSVEEPAATEPVKVDETNEQPKTEEKKDEKK